MGAEFPHSLLTKNQAGQGALMVDSSDYLASARILICENDAMLADEVAKTLKRLGCEVVRIVCSGEDAVKAAHELRPNLILMDISLNGEIDGIGVVDKIRRGVDAPVVYLTNYAEEDALERASNTAPYGYLSKPVNEIELKCKTETALYRHEADKRVREAEAKYRVLVEQLPAITYTAALDGASATVYISPQIETFLGYTQEEFVADSDLWLKRVHPDDRERVVAEVAHCHNSGLPFDSEYRMLARDGRVLWFHDQARLVCDEKGHPLCLQGVMLDITERKRAEQALREGEERFRAIFNNAAVGIDVLDSRGRFVEVNSALSEMLGYTKEELVQLSPIDLTHPDDLEKSKEHLIPLVEGKSDSYRLEKRYIRKDGPVLFADVMVSKILDAEGQYEFTIGVISDITERKKAEEALQRKTHELGERVKELNCLIGISRLREKSGASLEQMLQGIVDLIPSAWQFPEVTCARIILEDQEFKTWKYAIPQASLSANVLAHGVTKGSVEVSYLEERPTSDEGPFLTEERKLLNAIAERVGRMIERQETEKKLQEYRDELEDRVQERTLELARKNEQLRLEIVERKKAEHALTETAEALERSNQDLQQFAYVAAHDLREPLIGVTAYLKILERGCRGRLEKDLEKYIARGIDTALRMDALIQALLQYSVVQNNETEVEAIDCNVVLEHALTQLHSVMEESGAKVSSEELPTVMANSSQFVQLFQNLISNAIKFSGDKPPEIRIGVESTAEEYKFSVADNGIGIEPPYFDRVFRIFQRLEDGINRPGSGIGLASCRKIVERHGGRIWVESKPAAGSTFFFTAPRPT